MPLYQIWNDLSLELDELILEFEGFAVAKSTPLTIADFDLSGECLLEGLLSRTWQAWCSFCRACVVESCMGTVDGNGHAIAAHAEAYSEAHVSGAWLKARQSSSPWGGVNALLRLEPTWGDTDVLVKGLARMAPNNSGQLLAAFSSAHASAKDIQLIRNAAAHNNVQTFSEVKASASKYLAYPIAHPIHALYWIEPVSKDYLILSALEDLRDSALAAIS